MTSSQKEALYGMLAFMVAMGILVVILFFISEGETTYDCPEYGQVKVVVENKDPICVPWEQVSDFDQFAKD